MSIISCETLGKMFSEKEDLSAKQATVVNKVLWPQSLNKLDSNSIAGLRQLNVFPVMEI